MARPRPTYAQTQQRYADLATDFGLDLATRWFGAEAIASLPVRASGKNKGKPKGVLNWLTTTTAGYCPYVSGGAPVGMVVRAWIGIAAYSGQDDAVQGQWMGRVQSLCGSKALLGPEARERDAEQRARFAAEDARRWEGQD
jgi:hypothetical protein